MTTYTPKTRTPLNWDAPAQITTEYYLKIDDTFFLDIGSGYKLVIEGTQREETNWTTQSRTPLNY